MKQLIIPIVTVLAASALAASAFAAEPLPFDFKKPPKDEAERLARKAYIEKRRMEHTGGDLIRPGSQMGEVVYMNCQTRAPRALLEESAAYFRDMSKFRISIKDGGTFDLGNPVIAGQATLFVVDDPTLPPLLVAPESRWTMVNVAGLEERGKPMFFGPRVKKELSRGFAALCGAMNSQYPHALTRGIAKPQDLDTNADQKLPVDVISRFMSYMEPFGVTPAVVTTYRKACQEGWAPAPTNDYQKAILEQVKKEREETLKGPANPRKIKYDAKKGE